MLNFFENFEKQNEFVWMVKSMAAWEVITYLCLIFVSVPHHQCNLNDMYRIMIVLLKCPATKALPTLLDPMTKIVSFAIQKAKFNLKYLMELCSLSSRIFTKVCGHLQMKVFRHPVGKNSREMNQILGLHFTTREVACGTTTLQLANDPLWLGSRDTSQHVSILRLKHTSINEWSVWSLVLCNWFRSCN